jgi:putative tryptophan/tyrosine transport system substrate-binding protein
VIICPSHLPVSLKPFCGASFNHLVGAAKQRQRFVSLLGSAAAAVWPVAVGAQQAAMPVIGYLGSGAVDTSIGDLAAFREGLKESGYDENQNVAIEYRWAQEHNDRLPALAAELVRHRVAVLAALGTVPLALAAKASTTTIPIVFAIGADPVAAGLVTSLNRPGGNLTGATRLSVEVTPKRLEALRELLPKATTIALLVNPTDPVVAEAQAKDLDTAARKLGLKVSVLHAGAEHDFEPAFLRIAQMKADALVIGVNAFFGRKIKQLAATPAASRRTWGSLPECRHRRSYHLGSAGRRRSDASGACRARVSRSLGMT